MAEVKHFKAVYKVWVVTEQCVVVVSKVMSELVSGLVGWKQRARSRSMLA